MIEVHGRVIEAHACVTERHARVIERHGHVDRLCNSLNYVTTFTS